MKKVLFISGSFGLGHVIRDVAIARQMTAMDPGIEITWLAADPASREIDRIGGVLHERWEEMEDKNSAWEMEFAAQDFVYNPSGKIESVEKDKRNNFQLFCSIVSVEKYDLIVGDETRGIWFQLHKMKEPLDAPFVMIHDFVGLSYRGHS